jgi:hypothetical protein
MLSSIRWPISSSLNSFSFMDIVLPQEKTYFRSKLSCIYCACDVVSSDLLTREHIIPNKMHGRLILRHASCSDCAKIINSEIESFMLGSTLKVPRTQLRMKTSKPVRTLPIGRWDSDSSNWPQNMNDVNFRFEEIPVDEYPLNIMFPTFPPPGILWDNEKSELFSVVGVETYIDKPTPYAQEGTRSAICIPFSPDTILRFIAKIAHSAAIAALGDDSFTALLPDVILGKTKYISHFVGSRGTKRYTSASLHDVRLYLRRRYIVAEVRLFAKHIRVPYLAVVGRSPEGMASLHTSALMRSAIPQ